MAKTKKKERKRGATGVNKAAIQSTAKGQQMTVFKITDSAWVNFYRTPEGKNRLRRMKGLNEMQIDRYNKVLKGDFLNQPTHKQVYQKWDAKQNSFNVEKPEKVVV
jgi:hypothetical protein